MGRWRICLLCGQKGENCDGDKYFPELGEAMRMAFIKLSLYPDSFFGRWHLGPNDAHVSTYFNLYGKQSTERFNPEIPWVNYHRLLR
jgi:hypothetical protein